MGDDSKKAILCVDDEKIILQSLNGQLKSYFKQLYRLEFAESADEALELIEEFSEDGIQVLLILFFLNKIILSIKTKKIILLDNFGDSANQHVINLNINIQSQKFKVSIQKRGLF